MKKIILLFIILSATGGLQTIFAQVTQEWVATYTNPYSLSAGVSDMAIDTSGNTYITGGILRPDSQNNNFMTIKYNSSGIQQWAVQYNGPGSNSWDEGDAIAVDKWGNVYVTGISEQTVLWTNAFCTIKYNSSGVQQWISRYRYNPNSASSGDGPKAISVDDAGNVYVTGVSTGIGTGTDYATIKYNSNGDSVWVRRYNGYWNSNDIANSLIVDRYGNVFVTGFSNSGIPPAASGQACTIKYNNNGLQQWVSCLNETQTSGCGKIILDTNTSDIYVVGEIGASTDDYLLIKYNLNGLEQWVRRYDGTAHGDDIAFDIVIDNAHNVYISGKSLEFYSNYTDDYTTIKYNSNGDSLWVRKYDRSTSETTVPVLAIDKYNNIYLTGTRWNGSNYEFSNLKYSSTGSQQWLMTYAGGGASIKVDKYLNVYVTGGGFSATDIKTIKYSQPDAIKQIYTEVPNKFNLFQNYPNPFNPSTKIMFSLPSVGQRHVFDLQLVIYDILGREITTLINRQLQPGTYEVNWIATNYPNGVFFYRLTAGNFTQTRKMVLLK
jgi:hypothetical protein